LYEQVIGERMYNRIEWSNLEKAELNCNNLDPRIKTRGNRNFTAAGCYILYRQPSELNKSSDCMNK